MFQNRKFKFLFLASLAFLILLGGIWFSVGQPAYMGSEIAHHMAPNTNSVDIGNLNLETVHNGLNLGVMPVAPEIGGGNLNRQLWVNPPQMP